MFIHHQLSIRATARYVFIVLTNGKELSKWLIPNARAVPGTGNSKRFLFKNEYLNELRITRSLPNTYVEWQCLSAQRQTSASKIVFEIKASNLDVTLNFTYERTPETSVGSATSELNWSFLLGSLKAFCEFGKGLPFPKHTDQEGIA